MPGSPKHLVLRFIDVLRATPLTAAETEQIRTWLGPEATEVFSQQNVADQRHGFEAASWASDSQRSRSELVEAAALHDIGKRHASLGVMGRSLASILILLQLPLTRRMRLYRDHGRLAAEELSSLGATALTIEFAHNHHHARPDSISHEDWSVLQMADQPPKARKSREPPITSAGA